jgi:NTE family protein
MIADNQVRNLRKRHLIDAYKRGERKGCYWGIRTGIEHYFAPGKLPAPRERVLELAGLDTRLAALPAPAQERLINWGYAVSDAALRTHYDTTLLPGQLPYPANPI